MGDEIGFMCRFGILGDGRNSTVLYREYDRQLVSKRKFVCDITFGQWVPDSQKVYRSLRDIFFRHLGKEGQTSSVYTNDLQAHLIGRKDIQTVELPWFSLFRAFFADAGKGLLKSLSS